jgi:lipoate-protein ligase A
LKGRLLLATLNDPYSNVAAEEAIFDCMDAPAVRVWENQLSVVIGRAQLASAETDMGYCRQNLIPVVRRFTAGGAVYNGPGNLNWSLFVPRGLEAGRLRYVREPAAMFEQAAALLIEALSEYEERLEFRRPNMIALRGKKVSGMAGYIGQNGLLCHGTLLCGADLDLVQRLTRPSGKEVPRRYPRSAFSPVANLGVKRDEFVEALVCALHFEVVEEGMSEEEASLTESLVLRKYSRDGWNLGDPFSLDYG